MIPRPTLELWKALAEKATAGPWRWGDWSAYFGTVESEAHMLTLEHNMTRLDDPTPYRCSRADGRRQVLTVEASDSFGSNADNDKAFIAAARTAVPTLLAEVDRLAGERDFQLQCALKQQDENAALCQELERWLRDTTDTLDVVRKASIERGQEADHLRSLLAEAVEIGERLAQLVGDAHKAEDRLAAIKKEGGVT